MWAYTHVVIALADLLALWLARDRDAGPRQARDRETLEYMEGRVAVPMPEIAGMSAQDRAMVANLMGQGMTAKAQRIASTRPSLNFVAEASSKAARDRASKRRRATLGLWDENRLHLQDRQRARWLITYATSPVHVRPRFRKGHWTVEWELRTALSAYPAPVTNHLDMEPPDNIFASTASMAKLSGIYPDRAPQLRAMRGQDLRDRVVTLIEYSAPDEYVTAAVGAISDWDQPSAYGVDYAHVAGNRWCVELERVQNRVERCCAVIPNSIALEAPLSDFESMKGLYQAQAKLMALEYRAVANAVDPPVWFVESDTGGEIVTVADGPAGVVGHIRGGTLQPLNIQPGFQTYPTIDRLERAQRLEGGVPADFGGESGTNVRTARRGSELLAAVVDFPIQESQELLAESRRLETKLAIDIARAYFPDVSRKFAGFEWTPSDTFKGDEHFTVEYALAGADANGQVIRVGQLQGTGLMSKATARKKIPDIDDPEYEDDQVVYEQIQQGLLSEFMQPDPTGNFNIVMKNRVAKLVRDNKADLVDAIEQVQREAQEAQADTTGVVEPGAPEAQPGIAPPGVGVEAATAPPAQSDLAGLSSLLTQLRGPQVFETAGERAAGAAASV